MGLELSWWGLGGSASGDSVVLLGLVCRGTQFNRTKNTLSYDRQLRHNSVHAALRGRDRGT